MLASMLPSRGLIVLIAATGAALVGLRFTALAPASIVLTALGIAGAILALVILDVRLSWMEWVRAPLTLERRLPHAFAVGSSVGVEVCLANPGRRRRRGRYFELADPSLKIPAMPLRFAVRPGENETFELELTPPRAA